MKRMKKWMGLTLVMCLFACLFCGCSVKSDKELVSYAKRTYGPAKKISVNTGDDRVSVCMEDKKYGFQYEVSSSLTEFGIDGSTIAGGIENTTSNYDEMLFQYILENELLEKDYSSKITYENDSIQVVELAYLKVEEEVELCEKIASYDKNGVLGNLYYIYPSEELKEIGQYRLYNVKEQRLLDFSEAEAYPYLMAVEEEIGKHVTFERKIALESYKSVPGFPVDQRVYVLGADDSATVYFFYVDDKEYFVCDNMYTEENGAIRYYCNYPYLDK